MKKLILFIVFLLIPVSAGAWGILIMEGGVPAAGGDCSHVLFFLTFEENDTTGEYDIDGNPDCSDGDTGGVYATDTTLESSTPLIGSYSLLYDDAAEEMSFAVSGGDILDQSDGGVAVVWKASTLTAWSSIFYADEGGGDYIYFGIDGTSTDELLLRWNDDDGSAHECTSTTANLSTGTSYAIEVYWDITNDTQKIYVDNSLVGNCSNAIGALNAMTNIKLGDAFGITDTRYLDNFISSNDDEATRLYDYLNDATCPEAGGSAPCCD